AQLFGERKPLLLGVVRLDALLDRIAAARRERGGGPAADVGGDACPGEDGERGQQARKRGLALVVAGIGQGELALVCVIGRTAAEHRQRGLRPLRQRAETREIVGLRGPGGEERRERRRAGWHAVSYRARPSQPQEAMETPGGRGLRRRWQGRRVEP